jgi:uncharacterized protein YjbI with pentapeptide repeats
MKTNKTFYVIVMLVIAVALSVAVLPSSARDGWPSRCYIPDIEEAMTAAGEAQAEGDVAAFVSHLGEINRVASQANTRCIIGAVRDGVDLQGVDLSKSNLVQENMSGATLVSVELSQGDLHRTDLSEANLEGTRFGGANLQEVVFSNSNLREALLGDANLSLANLTNANLQEANFIGADLRDANLSNSDLQEAYLGLVTLLGADLRDANLKGANFWRADLRYVNLEGAIFDENTWLPDDTNWTSDTDMSRFTDPDHPDFWDPCPYTRMYCEDRDQ